jgi:hypothetical protein
MYILIILCAVESVMPGIGGVHLEAEGAVFRENIGNRIIARLENDPARQR